MDNSRVGGSNSMPVGRTGVFDSANVQGVDGGEIAEASNDSSVISTGETMKSTVAAEEFASEIRPFGEALEKEQGNTERGQGGAERKQVTAGGGRADGYSKNLGGSAMVSEGLFAAPPAPNVQGLETVNQGPEVANQGTMVAGRGTEVVNQGMEDLNQNVEEGPTTRFRALASDGSTEKKSKKLFAFFDGDTISKTLKAKIDREIVKHENNPFELDNVRNQEMTEFLRDEYGRIFGDDGNDNNGSVNNGGGDTTPNGGLISEGAAWG